jgi:type VI secretion system secreted protein VgrG
MLAAQENINLTLSTPLGKDALILDRLDGVEQISQPFCFSLDMHSLSPTLDLSGLVGSEVKVSFKFGKGKRYFCGIVGTAEQGWTVRKDNNNFTHYQAKVYPKFWLLKFTRDYRIFQNKSALDIIKTVLQENGVTEIQDKTAGCGKRVRDYCVQYGESCFDFVCRLMEEEGIFYFFSHTESTHKMILADDSLQAEETVAGGVPYISSLSDNPNFNVIHTLRLQEQVVAKKFAAADFNFETPSTHLYNKVTGEGSGGQIYDYPGLFMKTNEGDTVANHRIQDLEWNKKTLTGISTTPLFSAMFKFSLNNHPRADANKDYVLYQVHHRINQSALKGESIYENNFVAFPKMVPFRPPRVSLKQLIHSTQTAIVTTKAGEEIWCDEYGRIKVKFHWDQRGTNDEKSSCWIRVAQLWAGSSWGGLFTPRIGMEVVVTFLNGDPDRPLITGCVYNGNNMAPPYAKSEPTKSTIKSNSSKGGGGFNEFRLEDKKGAEEIFTHAQKDKNSIVEDARTLLIKTGNDTTTIAQGSRLVTLRGDKGQRPQRGDDTLVLTKGSRLVDLKGAGSETGNHTLDITKGDNTIHIKKGNEIKTLDQGNQEVTLSSGNQTIKIVGTRDITVNKAESHTNQDAFKQEVTKDYTLKVTGSLMITVTGAVTVKTSADATIKAAGNLNLESGGNMTLKAGGNLALQATASWQGTGLNVKLTGQTGAVVDGGPMVTVKGAGTATLQGGGMAVVKGGAVKIG